MTDFAELFSVSLYLDICCTLKYTLFILELLNQRIEGPPIHFHNQLFEIITEMYLSLPDYTLLAIEKFNHLVNRL